MNMVLRRFDKRKFRFNLEMKCYKNWNQRTWHRMVAMFRWRSILTSHDFSWLQNGQLKSWSSGMTGLTFGGGFRLLRRRPISTFYCTSFAIFTRIDADSHKLKSVDWKISIQQTFHQVGFFLKKGIGKLKFYANDWIFYKEWNQTQM